MGSLVSFLLNISSRRRDILSSFIPFRILFYPIIPILYLSISLSLVFLPLSLPLSLCVCLSVALGVPLIPYNFHSSSPLSLSHCYGYVPHCTYQAAILATIEFLLPNNYQREGNFIFLNSYSTVSHLCLTFMDICKTISKIIIFQI